MRLRPPLLAAAVSAVTVLAGCGGSREPGEGELLSRAQAIAQIDAHCRRTLAEVERVGPQPPQGSGSQQELARYGRWQARVVR